MYRDMTRGSITRGLLLFALPMAAGARVALAYAPAGPVGVNGIWAAIPIGWFLADAVGYGYYFLRRRALLPGERETADSRNQKERCVTYELHPICWTVWYLSNKWGVFICQREYHRIKLKLNGLNPVQYRIQTVQAA